MQALTDSSDVPRGCGLLRIFQAVEQQAADWQEEFDRLYKCLACHTARACISNRDPYVVPVNQFDDDHPSVSCFRYQCLIHSYRQAAVRGRFYRALPHLRRGQPRLIRAEALSQRVCYDDMG